MEHSEMLRRVKSKVVEVYQRFEKTKQYKNGATPLNFLADMMEALRNDAVRFVKEEGFNTEDLIVMREMINFTFFYALAKSEEGGHIETIRDGVPSGLFELFLLSLPKETKHEIEVMQTKLFHLMKEKREKNIKGKYGDIFKDMVGDDNKEIK